MSDLLNCRALVKRFGAQTALDGVDFALAEGEIHGLVGSNGAGKSTLVRILAGATQADGGTIEIAGRAAVFRSPSDALAQGVAMVYQELSGIGSLSVAENVLLGRQPVGRFGLVDWREMHRRAEAALERIGLRIDVRQPLERLPLGMRQMVEIARGLDSGARVLVLDEPTSSLAPPEAQRLHELVRNLAAQGVGIVLISHFLDEVLDVCDRVTILRDGRHVGTHTTSSLNKHDVVAAMLGRANHDVQTGYEGRVSLPPRSSAEARLIVRDLRRDGVFGPVSLEVAGGECLVLSGTLGAGHHELAEAIAGALHVDSGTVSVDGRDVTNSIRRAIRSGTVLVAADRKRTIVGGASIDRNVTLAHLRSLVGSWLRLRREHAVAKPLIERVGCRPADGKRLAGTLSGGNQQKVVVARWLAGPVRVLVLQEPTRGMDVAAKDDVLKLVAELKAAGAAVILATSEPELALAQADRIVVMDRGRVTHEFADTELDQATLLAASS